MSATLISAEQVSLEQVMDIEAPERTNTWHPISHGETLNIVHDALRQRGLTVKKTQYALTHSGHRMFATYDLNGDTAMPDYGMSLGIRNATDKSVAYAMAYGTNVFLCENLVLSGEEVIHRKHTSEVESFIRANTIDMLDRAVARYQDEHNRIAQWKEMPVTDRAASSFLWDLGSQGIVPFPFLKQEVWENWKRPADEEYQPTVWRMHNAFSESMKQRQARNPIVASVATQRFTKLLTEHFSVN